jgi:N-acetylornithine carbamoyltransferase
MREKLGELRGRKFVMSWAYSPSANKPVSVAQSAITMASKFGLDIVLAHPEGFELDSNVIEKVDQNVEQYGGSFQVSHDMSEAFADADIVYPKCWNALQYMPPETEVMDVQEMRGLIERHKDWICDQDKMRLARPDALYMHCMPAQRGFEVTDEVMDGPNSVVFDQAHNRMHAQKAILALLMA